MDYERAKNPYIWLRFSPLFTIPALFYINTNTYYLFKNSFGLDPMLSDRFAAYLGICASGLFHLILLSWALDKKSAFVRWHGRQALGLAILRTAIPLFIVTVSMFPDSAIGPAFLLNLLVWLIGNSTGLKQVKQGDCSLARWRKHEDDLPGPPAIVEVVPAPQNIDWNTEELIYIIRSSQDENERQTALKNLTNMGLVEDL